MSYSYIVTMIIYDYYNGRRLREQGRLGVLVTVFDTGVGETGELNPILDENGIPLDILFLIRNDIMNKSSSQGVNVSVGPLYPAKKNFSTYESAITLPRNFFNESDEAIRAYISTVNITFWNHFYHF